METDDAVILKKYASRRLYNPENSSYVTLNQVADLIRSGHDVQVIDAKTAEDVTAFILTQIVMEEARNKNVLLPAPFLHLIIRTGSKDLKDFFQKHLQQAISSYLEYKNAFDEQFGKWLSVGANYSEMAQKTFTELSAFQPLSPRQGKKAKETPIRKKRSG
jgi:polyhydroxyalkanoate synthesis repressor PhaR